MGSNRVNAGHSPGRILERMDDVMTVSPDGDAGALADALLPDAGGEAQRALLRDYMSVSVVLVSPSCVQEGHPTRPHKPGLVDAWCGRGDSNPHDLAVASPSSWCVIAQLPQFARYIPAM